MPAILETDIESFLLTEVWGLGAQVRSLLLQPSKKPADRNFDQRALSRCDYGTIDALVTLGLRWTAEIGEVSNLQR
jgi:hypothetical protein